MQKAAKASAEIIIIIINYNSNRRQKDFAQLLSAVTVPIIGGRKTELQSRTERENQ